MLDKEKKSAVIAQFATKEGDTGSPEVQVAILTARINELTEHFKPQDFAALHGIRPLGGIDAAQHQLAVLRDGAEG